MSTPSKSASQKVESPIDLLSSGLLQEFTSLRDLEVQLEEIVSHQQGLNLNYIAIQSWLSIPYLPGLIDVIVNLNSNYMQSEEIMEVQLMVGDWFNVRMSLTFLISL